MKALVVESDLMSQCVLAKLLAEQGHEVASYENAEQAILACKREQHPMVFVDVDLPGMSGLQFCKWLRSQPGGDRAFVMMAVSPGQPSELSQALSAGASDFLMKPYDLATLKTRLLVAERQMTALFRCEELEDQMQRRDQETGGMQAELRRAGESLVKEAEARRRTEEELETVRAALAEVQRAFDQKTKAQAEELCAKADQLNNVTSFRLRVEEDLKRVREELEARTGRHAVEVATVRKELAEEKARHRTLASTHEGTTAELQAQVRELTAAAREADERRLRAESEGQRAAMAFARAQADWEERQQELLGRCEQARQQGEVAQRGCSDQEREQLQSARAALEQQLAEAREGALKRMEGQALAMSKLDDALRVSQGERARVESELIRAREELGGKARDYAAAMVKAAEEMQLVWAELRELSQSAAVPAAGQPAVQPQEEALAGLRAELEREGIRRRELEDQLEKARMQQDRLRRFAETLEEG